MYSLLFFHATATTQIYTLSLHDALPICERAPEARARRRAHLWRRTLLREPVRQGRTGVRRRHRRLQQLRPARDAPDGDRKSTRLNSSHEWISYAVFCLKKKKTNITREQI